MWVPKREWRELKKRVADLERQVQGQQCVINFSSPLQSPAPVYQATRDIFRDNKESEHQ